VVGDRGIVVLVATVLDGAKEKRYKCKDGARNDLGG
jgi:hypothetical protein